MKLAEVLADLRSIRNKATMLRCPYREAGYLAGGMHPTESEEPMAYTAVATRDYVIALLDHRGHSVFWRWVPQYGGLCSRIAFSSVIKQLGDSDWSTAIWIIDDRSTAIGEWIRSERGICDWTT